MIIVGALVRTATEDNAKIRSTLAALPGAIVQRFEDPSKIGLVFEASGYKHARVVLEDEIPQIEGVLVVSPIHANYELFMDTER